MKDFNTYILEKLKLSKNTKPKEIEFIDLGLPSGTLWANLNVGVDPTKLDKAEDWFGDYYSWGETKPKSKDDECNLTKYKFYSHERFSKYNDKDGLRNIEQKDDAAYKIDNDTSFPTLEQVRELIRNTKHKVETNWNDVPGLRGVSFTSKNGKVLFIPCPGKIINKTFFDKNNTGYYWTTQLHNDNFSSCETFVINGSTTDAYIDTNYRYYGCSVRQVKK